MGGSAPGWRSTNPRAWVPIDETDCPPFPASGAAGDALGSYMSGIYTQIGSSLAAPAVQGAIAGAAAARASAGLGHVAIPAATLAKP